MLHRSGKALTPPCDEENPAMCIGRKSETPWDKENGLLPPQEASSLNTRSHTSQPKQTPSGLPDEQGVSSSCGVVADTNDSIQRRWLSYRSMPLSERRTAPAMQAAPSDQPGQVHTTGYAVIFDGEAKPCQIRKHSSIGSEKGTWPLKAKGMCWQDSFFSLPACPHDNFFFPRVDPATCHTYGR